MTPLSNVQMALYGLLGWLEVVPNDGGVYERQGVSRLDILLGVEAGRIAIRDACGLMGVRRRQVFRLLAAFRADGLSGLVSKRRGRPSNNRIPTAFRDLAMAIVKERYADFGPTLACEKVG